jgi:PhnB protein
MTNFTPYLLFDGNCAQAMGFYHSCFGGSLTLTRVSESPMKGHLPKELQNRIINARLQSGPFDISASDWLHPTRTPKQGNMLCLYISGAPYAELKRYFDQLSKGADPTYLDQLREMPFGSYGALTDKFGVRWMFQGSKSA